MGSRFRTSCLKTTAASFRIIKKGKIPESNITYKQRLALKKLKKDNSIVISQTDKGNDTVIMNSMDYKEKMLNLISYNTYKICQKDPMRKIEKTTKELLKKT